MMESYLHIASLLVVACLFGKMPTVQLVTIRERIVGVR